MIVLVSVFVIFLLSAVLGMFYFYRKYNHLTRLDKNIKLTKNISKYSAKRDLKDVSQSLKTLKEQINHI